MGNFVQDRRIPYRVGYASAPNLDPDGGINTIVGRISARSTAALRLLQTGDSCSIGRVNGLHDLPDALYMDCRPGGRLRLLRRSNYIEQWRNFCQEYSYRALDRRINSLEPKSPGRLYTLYPMDGRWRADYICCRSELSRI